jgi:dTDP-4-amino-4,6-dideoxygalactose transaminase
MASVATVKAAGGRPFVPTYQGLTAIDFVRPLAAARRAYFPFNVPDRISFYRARNAIYHLFRALLEKTPGLTVLAPDYNSGNEVLALRAAGANIVYCPIDRQMRMDPAVVERLCDQHKPHLLYVIHYVGWPQPMPELMAIARRRGMLVVEDCALSLLSEMSGTPLGAFGDWAVFCLYKTLPLPNGSLLVQNTIKLPGLDRLATRQVGSATVLGKTAELVVQRIRGRANGLGAALHAVKRSMGWAANALEVERPNVGDIGFNFDDVDLAMSPLTHRLLDRLDFPDIQRKRLQNYRLLDALLPASVERVFASAPDGTCPLFFPIVVNDKHTTALALQQAGIDALEFWNESMESGDEMGPDARFLRRHVLELPVHQDLTQRQISYVAQQVSILKCRAAA